MYAVVLQHEARGDKRDCSSLHTCGRSRKGEDMLRSAAVMCRSHVSEPLTRRSSGEEPVLGDPPSREDSLLGHMPSVNPAADKEEQFDSAIAAVSGGELGSCRAGAGQRSTLERVSEGGNTAKDSASKDGAESAPSNQARQGSEPISNSQTERSSEHRRSSEHGGPPDSTRQSLDDRPGQSLGSNGQQRNVSGGSSMSRDEIQEHAANIMDRMRSSAQPLPPTKARLHGPYLTWSFYDAVPREAMMISRLLCMHAHQLNAAREPLNRKGPVNFAAVPDA